MKTDLQMKKDIINISRLIYEKGLVAATDGNVSVRTAEGRIITTATGTHLGFLTVDQLVLLDMEGRRIAGDMDASSEFKMHIRVYSMRPDVKAVVHAHPPTATAFSIAGVSLARCVLPEVVYSLGSIPTTEYATPTTEEVPEVISEVVRDHDAMILSRHGSLTLGADLFDAFMKLERIEHAAKVSLIAMQLGGAEPLPADEVRKLVKLREAKGLKTPDPVCEGCEVCSCRMHPQRVKALSRSTNGAVSEKLADIIYSEIKKELGG